MSSSGAPDLGGADPVEHLLSLTDAAPARDQVFTLHAELEGGAYLAHFERLLRGWQQRGMNLTDLATLCRAAAPHEPAPVRDRGRYRGRTLGHAGAAGAVSPRAGAVDGQARELNIAAA